MPVYHQGYETYQGERLPLWWRWVPLWREEIAPFLNSRLFFFFMALAILPWALAAISQVLLHFKVMGNVPVFDEKVAAFLLANPWQDFMMAFLSIWVGSGLVARDRRDRTIEVFLGRALSPVQYLWAKGFSLAGFFLLFTLLPVWLMVLLHVGITGDFSFFIQHFRVLWGSLLYTVVGVGSLVLFVLALSSLSSSPRLTGLLLIGILFFGTTAGALLGALGNNPWVSIFGILLEMSALASHCLGADEMLKVSFSHSMIYFAVLTAASLGLLWWNFSRKRLLR
ncbi:MAG: hypothetical protein V2A78_13030 [bacterium]